MTSRGVSIEQLLRWRLARAEADAPPAPRADWLLARARPWWDVWPEQFRAQVERLGRMHLAYGYAATDPRQARSGHPVPALISHTEDLEAFARVLYFSVRDGRLRLRFHLDGPTGRPEQAFEVTFVSDGGARPLLTADAVLSVDAEYRLDAELSPELERSWEPLRVTDPMPFRFILRPIAAVS